MSELRSAIEELQSEVLADLPDARIEEDFAELHRAAESLEVERLRRLAEIERRATYQRDGHLSAASWLASTFKVAWGAAREQVRIARALEEMPATRRALDGGELSMSAVRVMIAARDTDREAFRESETALVEAARIHSMHDLQRVAAYWRQVVERDHALDSDDKVRAQRRLHASLTFLGMVRVDGNLDPETGETLLTALSAVLDAESRSTHEGEDRTPAQRRADALGEICRQWLDLAERPNVGGEKPHVAVTVGLDALRDGAGTPAELDHVGPVGETARRLACDASIRRVVMAGPSEPLDVGRQTPTRHPAGHAPRRDRPRSPLPIPRLRPAAYVVRRTPCRALGRRRTNGAAQPPAAMPSPPPNGPSTSRLSVGTGGRASGVQAAGCIGAGRAGSAVAASRSRLPSGARSGGSARPRTPWGAHG